VEEGRVTNKQTIEEEISRSEIEQIEELKAKLREARAEIERTRAALDNIAYATQHEKGNYALHVIATEALQPYKHRSYDEGHGHDWKERRAGHSGFIEHMHIPFDPECEDCRKQQAKATEEK
jgi:hypothetical protein